MTYDGVPYSSGRLVSPMAYHSDASFNGAALGQSLSNLYYVGREASRLMVQQNFGFNLTNPSLLTAGGYAAAPMDFALITEGYAWIPAEATHVHATIVFGALAYAEGVKAYHSLTVKDAGDAHSAYAEVEQDVPVTGSINGVLGPHPVLQDAFLPTRKLGSAFSVAQVLVDITGLTRAGVVRAYVGAYSDSSIAETYRPFSVCVIWQVRT